MARLDYQALNSTIRYLMFSVFQVQPGVLGDDREGAIKEARAFFDGLADHGKAARGYPDVRANTVSSFALGDYEWILAFEAPELHRIVDLMRDLRATEARLHVREEVPFFTGPRVEIENLIAALP